MTRLRRLCLVGIAGAVAGTAARIADPSGSTGALVFLATGLVLGELLVLRSENGATVPLSYAVMLVVASSFHAAEFAAAVAGAELIAAVLWFSDRESGSHVKTLVLRPVVAAATIVAYDAVQSVLHHREQLPVVLAALAAAAAAQVAVDTGTRRLFRLRLSVSRRARLAWMAIASSGVLMSIGYRGVGGEGKFGVWGPLLFSTPLLATWYAFERLDAATRAYHQTIESLAMAPEFGGIVPEGHSKRVAALSVAMAAELGVSASDTRDLEMAALLHHLGQVTLDEPEDPAQRVSATEVAAVTGEMLREIKPLAAAGDIVAGEASAPRRRVAAQILRVASDYDDLTARDGNPPEVAMETLRSAPGYVYDAKVLSSLELVAARAPELEVEGADLSV